jgi:hypothetical protein
MLDRKALGRVAEHGHFLMGAVFTWFCYILTHPIDPMYLLSGVLCMPLWLYLTHRALHLIPLTSWTLLPVFHIWGHHGKPKPIQNRTLELIAETTWEVFFWIFLPIWIQRVTGLHFIPTSIVLLGSLMWISIHIINYSLIGNETHSRHHQNTTVNYGPDIVDHLFGTNYDDTHEDTTYYIFNAMWAAIVVLVAKHYIGYAE